MERMTIGLSHPIRYVAQGGLIAGGFCMPSGLGIVGAAAIEKDVVLLRRAEPFSGVLGSGGPFLSG